MVRRTILLALSLFIATPSALADETAGVLRWHGEGTQIYDCLKSNAGLAWVLRQPDATLTDADGRMRAHHGAGPSWTAADGSRIVGHAIATIPAPRPGAIPWLVLQTDAPDGSGTLDRVTYVLRTETVGGVAPAGGCDHDHEGAVTAVPYQATYSFLRPESPASEPLRQAER
jgi:hypothetical protein